MDLIRRSPAGDDRSQYNVPVTRNMGPSPSGAGGCPRKLQVFRKISQAHAMSPGGSEMTLNTYPPCARLPPDGDKKELIIRRT